MNWIEAAGYETTTRQYTVNQTAIDLPVEPAREQLTVLRGTVFPPPMKRQSVEISAAGQNVKTKPDASGAFLMQVAGQEGDRIRLIASVDGKVVFDEYQILPGPVTVRLGKAAPPGWDKVPRERLGAAGESLGYHSAMGAEFRVRSLLALLRPKLRKSSVRIFDSIEVRSLDRHQPKVWGGRPLPKGYLDSWYRQNLTAPLGSPFPISPGQTQPSK